MKIKFLKTEAAKSYPHYGSKKASGMDIAAISVIDPDHGYAEADPEYFDNKLFHEQREIKISQGKMMLFGTGIIIGHMEGGELQVRPKSGLSLKGISVMFGTIDEDYRGEIKVVVTNHSSVPQKIEHGQWIAQLVACSATVPEIQFGDEKKEEITKTERGDKGFGSTGTGVEQDNLGIKVDKHQVILEETSEHFGIQTDKSDEEPIF